MVELYKNDEIWVRERSLAIILLCFCLVGLCACISVVGGNKSVIVCNCGALNMEKKETKNTLDNNIETIFFSQKKKQTNRGNAQ